MELSLLVAHKLECERQPSFMETSSTFEREIALYKQIRFSIKALNYIKTVIHRGQKLEYSISKKSGVNAVYKAARKVIKTYRNIETV